MRVCRWVGMYVSMYVGSPPVPRVLPGLVSGFGPKRKTKGTDNSFERERGVSCTY